MKVRVKMIPSIFEPKSLRIIDGSYRILMTHELDNLK